ncbi:hypothetical protein [Yoonia sp. BS5-3]|uniref:Uncharacterized protein n=1 Tax=Yoonia phaeophyticola TaxID=3137369 RepID=A0ABZ2V5A8_9RHOB
MKSTFIKLAGGLTLSVLATAAAAECTAEDVQAKTTTLSEAMQALATTDTAKMTELSTKMQEAMTAAAATGDQEAICENLDALIAEYAG